MRQKSSKTKYSLKPAFQAVCSVGLTALLLAGCAPAGKLQPAAATASPDQAPKVTVAPIAKMSIGDPVEQVADVVANAQVDVVTKVGGEVVEVLKKRGDTVKKGDVLLRIDNTAAVSANQKNQINLDGLNEQLSKARQDTQNGINDAQNTVNKLQQAASDALKAYNNARNSYDIGNATKAQVNQAETQYNNALMDLKSAQDKLAELKSTDSTAGIAAQEQTAQVALQDSQRSLSDYEVKATIDGVLTDFSVTAGMTVGQGTKVGQVQQVNPIKIQASLTATSRQLVKGKQELVFTVPGNAETFNGQISYLADIMSSQTKSYPLELTMDNSAQKLMPGMKVQVQLNTASDQNVLAIPTLSIVREGSDNYVFVLNGDHVEKRKITLGRLNGTIEEVLSGVKEGEQLVISGQNQLKDKEKAEVSK